MRAVHPPHTHTERKLLRSHSCESVKLIQGDKNATFMPLPYLASFCVAHFFIKTVLPIITLRRPSSFRVVCFSGFPPFSWPHPVSLTADCSQHYHRCRLPTFRSTNPSEHIPHHFHIFLSLSLSLSLSILIFFLFVALSVYWYQRPFLAFNSAAASASAAAAEPYHFHFSNQPLTKHANNPCLFTCSLIKSRPLLVSISNWPFPLYCRHNKAKKPGLSLRRGEKYEQRRRLMVDDGGKTAFGRWWLGMNDDVET